MDQRNSYWQLLSERNPKFASDTLRRERKAQGAYGPLIFSFAEPDAEPWLDKLFLEKRRQYLETGQGDWLGLRKRASLLKILSQTRKPDCAGVVSTLRFGDTWAAIHFGLKGGKTLHYWIPVYNPELSAYSPGRLLLRQIALHAADLGLSVIDRGVGESRAKGDFPSAQRLYFSGVWRRPVPAALAYSAIQSAAWRLKTAGDAIKRLGLNFTL